MKDIERLIVMHPEKNWNWEFLTLNLNVSLDFILSNMHFPWDFENIIKRSDVDLAFIEHNLKKINWCVYVLSRIATIEFHEKHPEIDWKYGICGMSNNPNVTFDFIKKYIDKEWDYSMYGLSRNSNLGIDFFKYFSYKPNMNPSLNASITVETIEYFKTKIIFPFLSKYIDPHIVDYYIANGDKTKKWDFYNGLSVNPKITHEFVTKYQRKNWNWSVINVDFSTWKNLPNFAKFWKEISSNPNITLDFVEKHIDKPWDFSANGLSSNHIINTWFIKKYSNKHWTYGIYGLSENPIIDYDFVKSTIKKPWYYPSLSKNPSIQVKDIINNGWINKNVNLNTTIKIDDIDHIDTNFFMLSMNKSITADIVHKYITSGWNWYELSKN